MKIRKLLFPFTWLYSAITSLRNLLFDLGFLRSHSYATPIISVGNITVGGTGKTPLSEYIIRLFKENYKICLLSRGYKRQTKGALIANNSSTASTIGDEPFQIMSKFPEINVCVAEKRVEGMEMILKNTNTNLVLMDDAYQHRHVKPGLSLLVIDYNRPLWKDCPFPAGDLRETRAGKKRAHIIVVNKCPLSLSEDERAYWLKKIKAKAHQQVYFTSINYGLPTPFLNDNKISFPGGLPILALAGIAQPQGFFNHLDKNFKVKEKLSYADHHHFSDDELSNISEKVLSDEIKALVTTEKDAVRLSKLPQDVLEKCWYIPIQLKVLFNEEEQFDNTIRNYVRDNSNHS
ncbi:tetraacyldisaccharide 4'-kinase [Carboxylicivirga sp. M1479]|uniref:tetraacyldisaccharide 4'-kinase n=1 Tax=Carboxylicivirga sp. M1479 TaxID=2594476 RepID=UPI0011781CD7|nr:tetraacyldisaccharide 4'-kinase [Carboxylicivirga sp. M1479]TRX72625.1 tetraacyldisaccharide 4'-kinase [Carboxylicivirga sp. M1479]